MDDDWGYPYDLGNSHVGMSEHEVALGFIWVCLRTWYL